MHLILILARKLSVQNLVMDLSLRSQVIIHLTLGPVSTNTLTETGSSIVIVKDALIMTMSGTYMISIKICFEYVVWYWLRGKVKSKHAYTLHSHV